MTDHAAKIKDATHARVILRQIIKDMATGDLAYLPPSKCVRQSARIAACLDKLDPKTGWIS